MELGLLSYLMPDQRASEIHVIGYDHLVTEALIGEGNEDVPTFSVDNSFRGRGSEYTQKELDHQHH